MEYSQLINKYFDVSINQAISQEHPIAIVTIGPENSGKEVITAQAQDELSHRGGSILIDKDLLSVADPQQTPQEKDSKFNDLVNKASDKKYNLVINQEYSSNSEFDLMSKSLKEKGYQIDVRTMSSPHEINTKRKEEHELLNLHKLNLDTKIEFSIKEDGTGQLLDHIENHDLADRVKVFDRVGNEVYNNEKNPDGETWLKQKEAYNIYNFEKNKPLAKSEAEYVLLAQHQLREIRASHTMINAQAQDLALNKNIETKPLELTLEKPKYIRQSKNFKDVQRGIVIEANENHVILKLNDTVGIEYDAKKLKDQKEYSNLRIGQELHINHSSNNPELMNEQEIMDYHIMHNDQSHDIGIDHNR